ncbi:MAG: hypothetical protein BWY33_02014 [Candidatus Dependentiae bacterium ADurb.Bin246]|nr:MAG: hypothetical protein BWY33_02014 [Candidatus Dependentiae bacterium ADurb.Bin246]
MVNTNISEKDAFTCLQNPKEMLHMKDKQKLFKILTTAKEEKTNYLIFPEFYMPVVWLYEFSNFAKIYGITIITGLQYLTCNDRAFNMICTLQTAKTKHGFKNCFPLFREKNYYAPDEKIGISKMKFRCQDNCNPFYYIISNPNIDFTTILCFEFTDISSRASMKTRIDVLFVPQFNKDTRYFSSIVESTTRDLHCFIIQANTSRYGDSRITAPFKTDFKDILQIKGGINDTVVVGEIDVAEFRHFQKTYTNDLEKIISLCYKCNKVRGKSVSKITSICKKCTKKIKKDKIKGLPPNFIR